MKRPPKYRRHSTRNLGFAEHAGKRTYFPGAFDSFESRDAYYKLIRSWGYSTVQSKRPEGAVTLALLTGRFLDWSRANRSTGRKSRTANLENSVAKLAAFAGNVPAVTFTPLRLKAMQAWLIDQKLSRRYINDTTSNVRLIFKWGVSEELVPIETYQALMTVSGLTAGRSGAKERPPRAPVPWKSVEATLAKLNPTVRAMVQAHWFTGVRSQSLCAARVGQFDRSTKPWVWKPKHKTEHLGHVLTVYVGPQAQKILAPFLKGKQPGDYVFQPLNKKAKRSRRYRSFYDPDSYRQAVARAAKRAGVPHWSPHQLRHARATLIREKHGLEAAQAALGHRRLDATQIYAQAQLAKAQMVALAMG